MPREGPCRRPQLGSGRCASTAVRFDRSGRGPAVSTGHGPVVAETRRAPMVPFRVRRTRSRRLWTRSGSSPRQQRERRAPAHRGGTDRSRCSADLELPQGVATPPTTGLRRLRLANEPVRARSLRYEVASTTPQQPRQASAGGAPKRAKHESEPIAEPEPDEKWARSSGLWRQPVRCVGPPRHGLRAGLVVGPRIRPAGGAPRAAGCRRLELTVPSDALTRRCRARPQR